MRPAPVYNLGFPYGVTTTGTSPHFCHAFIKFKDESCAAEAVANENGMFMMKLYV